MDLLNSLSSLFSKEATEVKKTFTRIQNQATIDQKLIIFNETLKRWSESDKHDSSSPELHSKVKFLIRQMKNFYFIYPFTLESRILEKLIQVTEGDLINFNFAMKVCSSYRYIKDRIICMLFLALYKFFRGYRLFENEDPVEQESNMIDYHLNNYLFELIKQYSNAPEIPLKALVENLSEIYKKKIKNLPSESHVYFLNNIFRIILRNRQFYKDLVILYFHFQYDVYFDHLMVQLGYDFYGTFCLCSIPEFENEFDTFKHCILHQDAAREPAPLVVNRVNYYKLYMFICLNLWRYDDVYIYDYLERMIKLENTNGDAFLNKLLVMFKEKQDLKVIMKSFSVGWPPSNPFLYAIFHILHNWNYRKSGKIFIRRHYIPSFYLTGVVIILRCFDEDKAVDLMMSTFDEIIMRYMHQLGPLWTLNTFKKIFVSIDENDQYSANKNDENQDEIRNFIDSFSETNFIKFDTRLRGKFGFFSFHVIEIVNALRKAIAGVSIWNYIVHWIKYHWESNYHLYKTAVEKNEIPEDTPDSLLEELSYAVTNNVYRMYDKNLLDYIVDIRMNGTHMFNIVRMPFANLTDIKNFCEEDELPEELSQKGQLFYVMFYKLCTFYLRINNSFEKNQKQYLINQLYIQAQYDLRQSVSRENIGKIFIEFLKIWAMTDVDEIMVKGFVKLLRLIQRSGYIKFNDHIVIIINHCEEVSGVKLKDLPDESFTLLRDEFFSIRPDTIQNMIEQIFFWINTAIRGNTVFIPHFRKFWETIYFQDVNLMMPKSKMNKDDINEAAYARLEEQLTLFHAFRKKHLTFTERDADDTISEKDIAVRHVESLYCYLGNAIKLNIGQYFYWKTLCELKTKDMNEYLNLFIAYLDGHMKRFTAIAQSDARILRQLMDKAQYKLANPDDHIFFVEFEDLVMEPENFFLVYFYLLRFKDESDYQEDFLVDFLFRVLEMLVKVFYLTHLPSNFDNIYSGFDGSLKYFKETLDLLLYANLTQYRICYTIYISCYIIGEFFNKKDFKMAALQIYTYITSGVQADYSLIARILNEKDQNFKEIFISLKKFFEKMK